LRQNINNVLFFAGEAVNDEHRSGCINGAFDTGYKAAEEISSVISRKIKMNSKLWIWNYLYFIQINNNKYVYIIIYI